MSMHDMSLGVAWVQMLEFLTGMPAYFWTFPEAKGFKNLIVPSYICWKRNNNHR
jgi:hypothetical protein